MEEPAFQDIINSLSGCFGCGRDNEKGLRIRSHWEGDEGVCRWMPEAHHRAGEGFINGGVLATVIDCHMGCTATAAAYKAEGRELGSGPELVYVTASLQVDYLRPTPAGQPVELRASIRQINGRKITVACSLRSGGEETVRGEAVFVRVDS